MHEIKNPSLHPCRPIRRLCCRGSFNTLRAVSAWLVFLLLLFSSIPAFAFRFGVSAGALGLGNGHPNAADFQSPTSYKIHATFSDVDISLAATQALVGKVFEFKSGAYVIPAAGLVVNANGSGPGVGATFGWTAFCWGLCAYIEVQNLLGAGPHRHLVSGSAARLGIDYSK